MWGGAEDSTPSSSDSSSRGISYNSSVLFISNRAHLDDYGNPIDPSLDFNIVEIWFAGNAGSSSAKRQIMGTDDPVINPFGTRNFNISSAQLKQYDYWPGVDEGPTDGKVVICMILQDQSNYFYSAFKELETGSITGTLHFYPRAYQVKMGRYGCGGSSSAFEYSDWVEAESVMDSY